MSRYRWVYHPEWTKRVRVLRCKQCKSFEMIVTEEPKENRARGKKLVARCPECLEKEKYRLGLKGARQLGAQNKAQPGNPQEDSSRELADILEKLFPHGV